MSQDVEIWWNDDAPTLMCRRDECMQMLPNGRRVWWEEEIPVDANKPEDVVEQANRHRRTHA